jgi:hypothetical protein
MLAERNIVIVTAAWYKVVARGSVVFKAYATRRKVAGSRPDEVN